jgi:hypothetical protein
MANQFSLPDHSIVSMKVCIIEKIYCHTTDPRLSEQITAMPYSCNVIVLNPNSDVAKWISGTFDDIFACIQKPLDTH